MRGTKLRFSEEEMRLVTDAGWILTKNSVMEKVVRMMAEMSEDYREIWEAGGRSDGIGSDVAGGDNEGIAEAADGAGADVAAGVNEGIAGAADGGGVALDPGSPKISRGENYRGLPWVMLDYPRIFGREDVLAIRTMFWWGHAFIVTLHLKGKYLRRLLPVLERDWAGLAAAGFHVGVSEDEWRHEHAEDVYRPLGGKEDLAGNRLDFLKLSATLGIDRWEEANEVLCAWFTRLASTLTR